MKLANVASDQDAGKLLRQGAALQTAGDLPGAERAYLAVLKKRPRDPDALHLLGVLYGQRGDGKTGLATIQKALAIRDDFPDAHLNAGTLAAQIGEPSVAEHHFRRAITFRPATPLAHGNLGLVLREQGRGAEAVEALRTAVQYDPQNVEMHVHLARTLRTLGDLAGQLAAAEAGLRAAPQHSVLEIIAAEARFGLGDLKSGWRGYRRRFQSLVNPIVPKAYSLPLWNGEPLQGSSILIWTEQGVGDEVMYANMFAEVIAAAARCVIQCTPRLAPLFRRSFPSAEIVDHDLSQEELRGITFQSPAASLGEWLRTDFQSFRTHTGYLIPDANLRTSLRTKYGSENLLVGLAWRSSPSAQDAEGKSMNILDWGPIFHIPGITFVNLQYGDCAAELDLVAKGFGVRVIQDTSIDPLKDIDAYAAQVAAMDVVISSSNSAAHFAGALGVPTLCMLPISLGRGRRWYWFAEHGACPWYPAMRLFLQRREHQWLDVIRDVGLEVADMVAARGVDVVGYLRAIGGAYTRMPVTSEQEAFSRLEDAEAVYRRLSREPKHAVEAYVHIGTLRKAAGDRAGEINAYDAALTADRTFWHAYNAKGQALGHLNRFKEAIATYRQGLKYQPQSPELHNNLAGALSRLGREKEAIAHYEEALKFLPPTETAALAAVELSYAAALNCAGNPERATEIMDALVARAPDHIDAHYNRSTIALSLGRFADAWPEFAWRLKRATTLLPRAARADIKYNPQYELFPYGRRWNGEPLTGKNVLIWTEQGLGDEILVASMIPDTIAAARHVTILCTERLVPLFRRSFPRAIVEERKNPLPKSVTDRRIDFQMSLSDLGAAFRGNFAQFPKRASFLQPDQARTSALRQSYAAVRPHAPIVGLSWSSSKNPELGRLKAPDFESLASILKSPGVTFVNLQYGDRSEELAWARDQLGVDVIDDKSIDSLANIDDFAAQVAAMDLVISTSNTAVHVAGSVGVPTWVLLAEGRGRHWYWFQDRTDSPWYPSVRLFRKMQAQDWTTAIARCAAEFRDWCGSKERA